MKVKCAECGIISGEVPIKTNADFLIMLGFCAEHQPEPEPERDLIAEFEEADRKLFAMAERGELLDAQGNPVQPFLYIQKGK